METLRDHRGKGTPVSATPTHEMVNRQLERIQASAMFSNSQHLQRFLQYVSEQALAGRNDEITEYLIAARVFARGEDFDPGSDTVVRTQAYRLRTKLKEYYETNGSGDLVVIDIPKGRYIPTFTLRNGTQGSHAAPLPETETAPPWTTPPPPAKDRKGRRIVLLVGAQVLVVALAASAGWGLRGRVADPPADARTPASSFWSSFLEDDKQPIIAFSNGVYLASEYGDLFRFHGSIGGDRGALVVPEEVERGLTNRTLLDKTGPLHFDDGITGTGDLEGAVRIAALLTRMGFTPTMKRSRLITTTDLRSHNVVFLGSPFDNVVLRDVARSKHIVFDFTPEERNPKLWGNRILDLDAGPEVFYTTECDPTTRVVKSDHAVISVLPGLTPNRRVMILGGLTTTGTHGAAEFTCSSNSVAELTRRLASGNPMPRFYEGILRVEAAQGLDVLRVHMVQARAIRGD